jgi:hypothetical protein
MYFMVFKNGKRYDEPCRLQIIWRRDLNGGGVEIGAAAPLR